MKSKEIWINPTWNKHVEEFGNTYFYALEAACCKIGGSIPKLGASQEIVFIFNLIINQGEDFTYNFLQNFQKEFGLKYITLNDLFLKEDIY